MKCLKYSLHIYQLFRNILKRLAKSIGKKYGFPINCTKIRSNIWWLVLHCSCGDLRKWEKKKKMNIQFHTILINNHHNVSISLFPMYVKQLFVSSLYLNHFCILARKHTFLYHCVCKDLKRKIFLFFYFK